MVNILIRSMIDFKWKVSSSVLFTLLFGSCMTYGPQEYQRMHYNYLAKHVQDCHSGKQSSMIDCKIAEEVYNKRIKTITLYRPGMKDASIEEGIKNAVVRAGYSGSPLRAVIVSDHWNYNRDSQSGILTSRELLGNVAMQESDDSCYFLTLYFGQNFNGSQYEEFYITHSTFSVKQKILCENVKVPSDTK